MSMRGLVGSFVCCGLLSLASVARASPELQAELVWHGRCDDAEDLVRQVRARGAELELQNSAPPSEGSAARRVRVEVTVNSAAPPALSAEIQLQNEDGRELRRVQASACGALRSAVAWVLVVLAQQRVPERSAPSAPEREQDSAAAFPDVTAVVAAPPAIQSPREPSESADTRAAPVSSAHTNSAGADSWALGCSFTAAFGFVPAPAFGPMLFGRFRSRARWLPTLQLSVQRLATFGFESNGTSISLTRDAARLAAWLPLVSNLHLGFAAEAGRLVAAGSGSTLAHGSSDSSFWFALGVPLRYSIPLIGRQLQAELQAELDYSPVPYTFRYGSGDTLTSTNALEGRAQLGLVSLF